MGKIVKLGWVVDTHGMLWVREVGVLVNGGLVR